MFHVSFQTRFQILVDVAGSKWFLECINTRYRGFPIVVVGIS